MHRRFGLRSHVRLQFATFGVQRGQTLRQLACADRIVRKQAFDTQADVVDAPGRIEPRRDDKPQVRGAGLGAISLAAAEKRGDAGARAAFADTPQTGFDEDAIVVVQGNEVGDRAEGHEIEQRRKIGFEHSRFGEPSVSAQAGAQCQQQIEHHADAGQGLARERVAGKIRVDHRIGIRERSSRQMMIGDDDTNPARSRRRDACVCRHAIVDRDEQVGSLRGQFLDQGRAQAVAVHGAIRHAVAHIARTQQAQAAQRNRCSGRAVAIEIADHDDALLQANRVSDDRAGTLEAAEIRRQHSGEAIVDLRGTRHAARREDAPQNRMPWQLRSECGQRPANDTRRLHAFGAAGTFRQKRQRCLCR